MVFKWVLIVFGVAVVVLFVLGKVLAFMNPPRPGRPRPALLRRVERTLRWVVLVPLALALGMLALALGTPR
jgi:hypothetical protein